MAERLKKLEDLKTEFTRFPEMAALVGKIERELKDVGDKNVRGGGHDQIGKQYHDKVDKPTASLSQLVESIRLKLLSVGEHGESTADLFDAADEHAADLA
ncbi:hypothetical protein GCM10010495_39990 [Kitasatospora herbaricolor]|uniref:hypothetical protein n=1 Tax=Kitasatospora herbaricolor TaxID=68217 RepID=UPI00174B0AA5|nr:hypothetical protein [Kitasatospora herbaricolor]MDQ0313179.1 hypothetical protein [Kitasatospora herbaricolor]GGV20662.1 hypothetical protein GCM10010495_39990 [Kitasatospora herbaricolor]